MANRIQLRRDSSDNWALNNPTLFEGEVGIETDTRKQKFGNGSTAWLELPYATVTPEQLDASNPSAFGLSFDQSGRLVINNQNNGIALQSNTIYFGQDWSANFAIDGISNLTINAAGSLIFNPLSKTTMFMNDDFYPVIKMLPAQQTIEFRDGSTENQAGSISFNNDNVQLYSNNGLNLISNNSDIVLNADGFSYLWNNQDSNNRIATVGDIQNIIDSAPDALNTLKELATALNNDPSFASTIVNALANKADLDLTGNVPASQLGNATGGSTANPIHPFAMIG